jgi:hypothetical protein
LGGASSETRVNGGVVGDVVDGDFGVDGLERMPPKRLVPLERRSR